MKADLGRILAVLVLGSSALAQEASAVVVPVEEDVMTSSFFTGTNLVRGYPGDNRPVLRVSTDGAFGLAGAETIYLTFDYDFSSFTGPVHAILSMQSVSGGFGADASIDHPFTVSAHAVDADPLASIADDTNPGGTISWSSFYADDILAADAAARTTINGFGTVQFDVSSIVNGWVAGTNPIHAIALTGKNDLSGDDFLHGFSNDSELPGATFLTVTPVPEPGTYALLLAGLGLVALKARKARRAAVAEGGAATC